MLCHWLGCLLVFEDSEQIRQVFLPVCLKEDYGIPALLGVIAILEEPLLVRLVVAVNDSFTYLHKGYIVSPAQGHLLLSVGDVGRNKLSVGFLHVLW